jgi:nicotinamide-nucleotide amidase
MRLEEEIGDLLRQQGLTLGVVESATGGLISHRITNVPGSSDYYKGSVTAYSNEVKSAVVGVSQDTLMNYGAVSPQVAEEMAEGGKMLLGADICIADTGIAGPAGATPEKPVGLFYLGLSHGENTYSRKHNFQGDREQNKQSAAEAALSWLKEYLLSLIEARLK